MKIEVKKLEKRTILITGSTKGIGLETARQLAVKGHSVIISGRNSDAIHKAEKKLNNLKLNIHSVLLDIEKNENHQEIISEIIRKTGRIDVLINNGGILMDENDSSETIAMEKIQKTMQINTFGAISLMQTVLPYMKKQNFGRIINVSSGMGAFSEMGNGYLAYRLSKTALNSATKIMSFEAANYDIAISAVCPGWVKTDMGGKSAPRPVEKGAETIVWLAESETAESNGKFFRDKKQINW